MKKLNAVLCKDMIGNLKASQSYRDISLSEEIYLQALEIALPLLEQQESRHKWDEEGERCVKCGDKDWFAGSFCEGELSKSRRTTDTYRQIENDGWIDWDGTGGYPTRAKAFVEIKHKDGHESKGFADQYYWSRPGLAMDIIAYRVIEND